MQSLAMSLLVPGGRERLGTGTVSEGPLWTRACSLPPEDIHAVIPAISKFRFIKRDANSVFMVHNLFRVTSRGLAILSRRGEVSCEYKEGRGAG